MTKPDLRVGLIGTGRIGKVHAEHLAYRVPGARLAALADVNRSSAEACASRWNVPQVYDDPAAFFASPDLDAVVICSSTNTHSRFIEEAAAAGKHVFCEKPIDFDLARIDSALRAVERAGVKLQIGFNRRFDPNFFEVRKKVAEGAVGELRILRISSRDPYPPPIEYVKGSGGMFLDMTIHDFDMARYLVGSDVKRVFALGGVRVDQRIGEAGDIDTALITLEFENGVIGSIDNCREAVYGYDQRVEVFGSEGMIRAENNTPSNTQLCGRQSVQSPLPLTFFMDRYIDSFILEMRAFVDAVRNDTETPVTGRDGRLSVLIGLAAQRSLKENRPVDLSEIDSA